ncbi:uracil-DNA glycosylase [Reinekea thalattae]|uniref:Uracil-DNA glycosylase n=1 Tax=Reinekea thalattae TaxID=2593301 RepID=A0A5C8Z732_9GAMM|nr:uracil-DNA glycosylase [Reinekea thalattae]TXR53905.1 uracil-DNA glycosylase [Reinekea thalattae]
MSELSYLFASLKSDAWQQQLSQRVALPVLTQLAQFLQAEQQANKTLYPQPSHWFRALNSVASEQVRVVVLGQDPYHGAGQANGLAFSVPDGVTIPPSLKNIFKEQQQDLNIENQSGDLSPWAQQGVLLLNSVLTVEAGQAGSHADKGWEQITDAVIRCCNEQTSPVVFMLWGSYAKSKKQLISNQNHLVLESVHPSPLSAYRGWFGSAHFSKANRFLLERGLDAIEWQLPSSELISKPAKPTPQQQSLL